MAIELKMPALSPTMEKGTLARWLVKEGDAVQPGDLLAEIETDKATMEFEAVDEGFVTSLVVPEGTNDVPVGTTIALIGDGLSAPAPASAPEVQAPIALAPPEPKPTSPPPLVSAESRPTPDLRQGDVNATPLARRIATIRGLSLSGIVGSGARGRIVKADLGLPASRRPAVSVPGAMALTALPVTTCAPPPANVPVETIKLSGMRRTIARRLTESKQQVPHFYLTARCNLDALLKLRTELNAGLSARGLKLSVNDFMIKALALALIEVPDANVQYGGDELHRFARADISMAVAIDGGLVTPVITDAAALSLSAVSGRARSLAAKAREGKLVPEDYQGGTASISNLGMFGIDEMFPVINPPQALILGVAAALEQPWKVNGEIALANIVAATASFDHRAIDGAVAAQFMAALRELVENPLRLAC